MCVMDPICLSTCYSQNQRVTLDNIIDQPSYKVRAKAKLITQIADSTFLTFHSSHQCQAVVIFSREPSAPILTSQLFDIFDSLQLCTKIIVDFNSYVPFLQKNFPSYGSSLFDFDFDIQFTPTITRCVKYIDSFAVVGTKS